jgi:O-antigen ligase
MHSAQRSERYKVWLAVALLATVFLFGGSARADAFSQFFARSAAVLFGSGALLTLTRTDFGKVKMPLLLCAAWTGLIVFQLIPLPPAIWTALPGREMFVGLAARVGMTQPWRPLSLVPEATANSALAMLVPLAVLVTVCQVPGRRLSTLLITLVGFTLVSGLIGVAQVAAGGASYFYEISNRGDGVGLFANRNHQAVMLAATVPLLAGLANLARDHRSKGVPDGTHAIFASIVFVLIFPLVFVTGSRSGVLLLLVGTGLAALILLKMNRMSVALSQARSKPVLVLALLAVVAAGAGLALFRVGAVDRLLTQSLGDDLRVSLFGTMINMADHYFPVGGGFGAFPTIFKIDEPFSSLNYSYFNHAHDDILEIVIEGGLPAVVLTLLFLGWFVKAAWRLWRAPFKPESYHSYGLAGTAALLVLLVASLTDYPLRTPGLAAVAAVLAAFIARADISLSSERAMVDRRGAKDINWMDANDS